MFKTISSLSPSRTLSNLNRTADRYGDLHFISFLGSTLSRLAYFNDNKFFENYKKIMGPVIVPRILEGINSVMSDNLEALLDDQTIFGLTGQKNDIFANYEYVYNNKKYIDFIKLNMPQNINIINGDLSGMVDFMVTSPPVANNFIKYISIGWSNYGEIYAVADKRMPNTIFLIFRGTYSAKTAGLYLKPTSLVPLTVCNDEKFLYGIFKTTVEMIHTIIESLRYLANDFLKATQPNSVKIFTTGHSLGGAMCTNFAYLWMGIKKTAPYNSAPYNVLADNIVCVSLGSPRCMGSSVAQKFCEFVRNKKILYLRITTRGDPFPGLPPKLGYEHPCSTNEEMRKKISEDCNATLNMIPYPNVDYTANLDCQNYKTRTYLPNQLSHTIYLDILYLKAIDIGNFLRGIGSAKEVSRDTDSSTVCRLIMGEEPISLTEKPIFKAIFFNVNKAREIPTNVDTIEEKQLTGANAQQIESPVEPPVNQQVDAVALTKTPNSILKIGGKVAEDVRMTSEAFDILIKEMLEIITPDVCPQTGKMVNPFNNKMMPELGCSVKFGGRRGKRKTQRKRKSKGKRNKGRSKRNRSRRY